MDLGGKEAAEHHRAAQTDGDAHGSGLHLYRDEPVLTCSDELIVQLANSLLDNFYVNLMNTNSKGKHILYFA